MVSSTAFVKRFVSKIETFRFSTSLVVVPTPQNKLACGPSRTKGGGRGPAITLVWVFCFSGDPTTFWCSLPKGLDELMVSNSAGASAFSVTFPQVVTVAVTVSSGAAGAVAEGEGIVAPGAIDTTPLRGVRLRISNLNLCGAKVVQVQAVADPADFGLPLRVPTWVNITKPRTLCCSSSWQYLSFPNASLVPTSEDGTGIHAVLRVLLYNSFGNPHR